MKLKKWLLLLLCVLSMSASAQWTEKWPIDVKIGGTNAVSIFLRAHFGKVGEVAAKQVDSILNNPQKQAKLAASTIRQLENIYTKYQRDRVSGEDAARQAAAQAFIAEIEADLNIQSPPSGLLNIVASFSPKYGVTKLQWDRLVNRNSCQKFNCRCPDGSVRPGPGFECPVLQRDGFYGSVPVTCNIVMDIVDTEAEYKIYRNAKLLATFSGAKQITSGQSFSLKDTFGAISASLRLTLSPRSLADPGKSAPFYDFDPQNENFGVPLVYTVLAETEGCSQPYSPGLFYNNQFTGWIRSQSTINVDSDGDARPDFIPQGVFFMSRLPAPNPAVRLTVPDETVWFWQDAIATVTIVGTNPSGSVNFFKDGLLAATVPVVNGIAQVNYSVLKQVGDWRRDSFLVVAVYSGDANHASGYSEVVPIDLYRD
jgi:hypothetical protein